MLRIHFMQSWFTFDHQTMEESLIDMALFRVFARINVDASHTPDRTLNRPGSSRHLRAPN